MPKKQVLFVDDELGVLQGLRRILRPLRNDWDMVFTLSGGEALELMKTQIFDVVVSDIRMPEMDGVALLGEIKSLYPDTVRFALSGHAENQTLLESTCVAHQFLAKPCEVDVLKDAVQRVFATRQLLSDSRLSGVVSGMAALPSVSSTYAELMEELKSENATMESVGRIVEKDVAMTAKILQLVNSAFFGLPREVSTPKQAASLLGLDVVRSLVLGIGVFSQFSQSTRKVAEAVTHHSLSIARLAQRVGVSVGESGKALDTIFMTGMLHDVGELIIADQLSDARRDIEALAENHEMKLREAEKQVVGCSHEELGAYLLGIWGLPNPIVEAVLYHHEPSRSVGQQFSPLSAVHVAEALSEDANGASLDVPYLERLGLVAHVPQWCEMAAAHDTF